MKVHFVRSEEKNLAEKERKRALLSKKHKRLLDRIEVSLFLVYVVFLMTLFCSLEKKERRQNVNSWKKNVDSWKKNVTF
jgi:hypothetical protein